MADITTTNIQPSSSSMSYEVSIPKGEERTYTLSGYVFKPTATIYIKANTNQIGIKLMDEHISLLL